LTEPKVIPDLPTIRLNDRNWPVPEFGPRVLRECREQIRRANDAVLVVRDDDPPLPEDKDAANAEYGRRAGGRYAKLSNAIAGDMFDAVYWALKAAHRDLERGEFDDWPITDDELFAAYLVARRQSGIYGRFRNKPSGEAGAASETSQSAT